MGEVKRNPPLSIMALKKDRYAYRVIWSAEDDEYVGLCEEFPSLSWLAETPDAAFSGIREIVSEIITDMQKTGEEIPEPLGIICTERKIPFYGHRAQPV